MDNSQSDKMVNVLLPKQGIHKYKGKKKTEYIIVVCCCCFVFDVLIALSTLFAFFVSLKADLYFCDKATP